MNRNQLLLLFAIREVNPWERIQALFYLSASARARAQTRRYTEVRRLLAVGLAGPDTLYHVEIRKPAGFQSRNLTASLILAILLIALGVEWKAYTGPAFIEWLHVFLHRCGIR